MLVGCSGRPDSTGPYFSSEVIEISVDDLPNYWVNTKNLPRRYSGKPERVPVGEGKWSILMVIDSNGVMTTRKFINSVPEGFMTQDLVNKMSSLKYTPSSYNAQRVPVTYVVHGFQRKN